MRLGAAPNQPGWPNKLNVRILRNARGNPLRLDVVFPQGKDYAFNEYHQSFSYDGVHWHPIAWTKGYLESPLADSLTFPPFTGDQVWIGTQTPMSWDVDALGLIARWKTHPDVTVHIVGKTLGGRDMLRLEITSATSPHPRARRWVHYFANQHPGEHNSQWRLAGLVDWLLSDAAADVRQRQIVHVVLMMSPDAPAHGWYRVNQQGVDMNRSYSPTGANKATQAHEAYLWQRDLEGLMASDAPVTTIWAIHTWSGIVEPQLIPGPELQAGGLGEWTALRATLADARPPGAHRADHAGEGGAVREHDVDRRPARAVRHHRHAVRGRCGAPDAATERSVWGGDHQGSRRVLPGASRVGAAPSSADRLRAASERRPYLGLRR